MGRKHLAQDRPNQDAAAVAVERNGSVAAVADGHSMKTCCRADRGSRFAVELALEIGRIWLKTPSNETFSPSGAFELSEAILHRWLRRVRADIGENPFTREEREALGQAIATPAVAYGTTVMAAIATERVCLALQLGDGQAFAVTSAGTAKRLIIPAEQEGEASDSLCQPDALEKFRYAVVPIEGDPLAAIICSTDGYDKSFRTVGDFLQVGGLIVQSLRAASPVEVAASLPAALREASDEGSGDDASCAILYCKKEIRRGRAH